METVIEDAGLDLGPTLTSSWDAACGALTQSLLLTRTGPRAPDLDFEQLLEPPAPGCAGPGPGDSHAAKEPGGGQEPRWAREPSEAAGPAGWAEGGGAWRRARLRASGLRWAREAVKLVFRIPESGGTPPQAPVSILLPPTLNSPSLLFRGTRTEQDPRHLRKRHIVIFTFSNAFN